MTPNPFDIHHIGGKYRLLGDLFPGRAVKNATQRVTGLAIKLSQVKLGSVYFPNIVSTTPEMVANAIEAGAVAVVGRKRHPWDLPAHVTYVRVENVRTALAQAAASFYPRQPETIVAVTGTAGKSSVVDFSRQLFAALGHRAASMGTVGLVAPEKITHNSTRTTPSTISLHRTLNRLARKGLQHLAMEASSNGLHNHRLDYVRLAAAGFTNLGHDHLNYHSSMETYFAAKMRLFMEVLPDGRTAVVNADGSYAERVIAAVRAQGRPLMTVGRRGEDIRLLEARREGQNQHLVLSVHGAKHEVHLPLLGAFQVENALLAVGLVMAATGQRDEVLSALSRLQGVPGRLEHVVDVNGAQCFVDYAHKPEALAAVLEALRPITSGRLVCVFGCGGNRDLGKRPMMGRIASEKADVVIVTDDNPRTEDPTTIRAQILAAAPAAREIGDRGEAIRTAVRELRPGDVLVVAGKGHETGQTIGRSTIPFSDHEVLVAATHNLASRHKRRAAPEPPPAAAPMAPPVMLRQREQKAHGARLSGDRGNLPAAARNGAKARVAARIAKADNRTSDLLPIILPIVEELKAAGAVSLRQIAAGLNAKGIKTARGGAWRGEQVKRVLGEGEANEAPLKGNGSLP